MLVRNTKEILSKPRCYRECQETWSVITFMDTGEKVDFPQVCFPANMDYKVKHLKRNRDSWSYTQIGISYMFNVLYGLWSTLHVYYFIPPITPKRVML